MPSCMRSSAQTAGWNVTSLRVVQNCVVYSIQSRSGAVAPTPLPTPGRGLVGFHSDDVDGLVQLALSIRGTRTLRVVVGSGPEYVDYELGPGSVYLVNSHGAFHAVGNVHGSVDVLAVIIRISLSTQSHESLSDKSSVVAKRARQCLAQWLTHVVSLGV